MFVTWCFLAYGKTVKVDGQLYRLELLDTAGQVCSSGSVESIKFDN